MGSYEPIKLLLKGKPFVCECLNDTFIPVRDKDAWECAGCGVQYDGRDGKRQAFPESKG